MKNIEDYTLLERVALLIIGMIGLSIYYWYFTLIALFYIVTVIF